MSKPSVLARKYRPTTFSEVRGQEHTVESMLNSIAMNKLHNTYLLSGTRGVGKTTLARIFAKTINCLTPKENYESCGVCSNCLSINDRTFPDIIEIDAASNRSIDSTRENIVKDVYHPPSYGKYKIYIIDEAHMLTPQAFATLLKTLEEPPEYAKFIMCTTDPHKVLPTIISRSMHFSLMAMTPQIIVNQLQDICKNENIEYELPALEMISHAGDGSMRDSLSLADQAIAQGNGKIKQQIVARMLGLMDSNLGLALIKSLAKSEQQEVWNNLKLLHEKGTNWETFTRELCNILHSIALAQFNIVENSLLTNKDQILSLAREINPEVIQFIYEIFVETQRKIFFYPSPRQSIEMACLRLLAFTYDNTEKKTLIHAKSPKNSKNSADLEKKLTDSGQISSTNDKPVLAKNIEVAPHLLKPAQEAVIQIEQNSPNSSNLEANSTTLIQNADKEEITQEDELQLELEQDLVINRPTSKTLNLDHSSYLKSLYTSISEVINFNPQIQFNDNFIFNFSIDALQEKIFKAIVSTPEFALISKFKVTLYRSLILGFKIKIDDNNLTLHWDQNLSTILIEKYPQIEQTLIEQGYILNVVDQPLEIDTIFEIFTNIMQEIINHEIASVRNNQNIISIVNQLNNLG